MTGESGPMTLSDLPSVRDGILCDMLLGPPPGEYMDHFQKMRRTGFSHISLSMAGDDEGPAAIYAAMARMRRQLSLEPDKYVLVDTVNDIRAAKKSARLSIGFHFQGTEAIGRDLANVGAFYKLGVRWMLMAYNFQNNVGTGCVEAQKHDSGLTDFGRELIKEMNRVGMLVDCSHTGYRTTMDAMEASTQPAYSRTPIRARCTSTRVTSRMSRSRPARKPAVSLGSTVSRTLWGNAARSPPTRCCGRSTTSPSLSAVNMWRWGSTI